MTDQPAFPLPAMRLEDGRGYPAQPGLTKREWFAGMALQGQLATGEAALLVVKCAYSIADSMIAASKETDQ